MSELKIVERSITCFRDIKNRECFVAPSRNKTDLFFRCKLYSAVNAVNLSSGALVEFASDEEVVRVSAKLEKFPSSVFFTS